MDTPQKYSSIHYQSYLALEQLLSAQNPRSAEMETGEAHEEMLFIIVHQSYEIWFKQIIHELESVINMFNTDVVDEKNIGTAFRKMQKSYFLLLDLNFSWNVL
ncbi:MAG TPA: tryptophan 2,3-dioxygenase family protein, partial [Saprospiraceae bacterium]|nr:tryptophan 2,3-dioxygenase family protein [Saprospiraceae bacterium]